MPHVNLRVADLPADRLVPVEHEGTKLVVIRWRDRFFAFHNVCPHAYWPLSEGSLKDGVLECAGHGWEFNIETGRCLNAPVYCLTPVSGTVDGETVRFSWDNKSPFPDCAKAMPSSAG